MEISILGIAILIIQGILFWLITTRMSGWGSILGGGLSGWIASSLGFVIMYFLGHLRSLFYSLFISFPAGRVFITPESFLISYLIVALVSVFLLIVTENASPDIYNIPIFGKILLYVPRVGIVMGVVFMGITTIFNF